MSVLALSPFGHLHLAAGDEAACDSAVRWLEHDDVGAALLSLAVHREELGASWSYGRDVGRLAVDAARADPRAFDAGGELALDPDELVDLVARVPPMPGAEYVSVEVLTALARATEVALRKQARGGLEGYLEGAAPHLSVVGRVCFHLAENKNDPTHPFAFLATYAAGLDGGRVRHRPLGEALREYASARDRKLLDALLSPVTRAAQTSGLARRLLDERTLFHPLAWTASDAHAFLGEIAALEQAGVVVRVPDWWRRKKQPRPQLTVTIGSKPANGLGIEALLDVSAALTFEGEPLTDAERARLLSATRGLVLLRGLWVEVDGDRLTALLAHWKKAQAAVGKGGLSFAEAMRLLAGSADGALAEVEEDATAGWSSISAGPWLDDMLARLRDPSRVDAFAPGAKVKATLRPYQRDGVRWAYTLAQLGLGGCLADDMGLGKTLQMIALLTHLDRGPHLLVVPASLVGNWTREIERFAPELRVLSITSRTKQTELAEHDIGIVTYAMLPRVAWLSDVRFGAVVVDEAQALKNPTANQTRAAKKLKAQVRFALTGTPVENRLGDLWSIFDFVAPGLLGSAKAFGGWSQRLEKDPRGFAPLRSLLRPYLLRRLKSDKTIVADLPDKTEVRVDAGLTRMQAVLYRDSVDALSRALDAPEQTAFERRGLVLAYLTRFKQICNHPSQWLQDGQYEFKNSGKMLRLRAIAEEVASRQEKMLVFTQFRTMVDPLAELLAEVFGQKGVTLHGDVPPKKRLALVDEFQREGGAPFFVLSLKAGGSGLNLTAATHVVHFDRWWNPAVEDQATDRAYRIGQHRNVLVHKMVCRGTIEERIDALLTEKRKTAAAVLEAGAELDLAGLSRDELMRLVALDMDAAVAEDAGEWPGPDDAPATPTPRRSTSSRSRPSPSNARAPKKPAKN